MARKKVPHKAKAQEAKQGGAKLEGEAKAAPQVAPAAKQEKPSQAPKAAATKANPFTRFATYVDEARAELRKVSWPTFPETRKATLVVLAFVTVMSILLGLVDLGLSSLIQLMLS